LAAAFVLLSSTPKAGAYPPFFPGYGYGYPAYNMMAYRNAAAAYQYRNAAAYRYQNAGWVAGYRNFKSPAAHTVPRAAMLYDGRAITNRRFADLYYAQNRNAATYVGPFVGPQNPLSVGNPPVYIPPPPSPRYGRSMYEVPPQFQYLSVGSVIRGPREPGRVFDLQVGTFQGGKVFTPVTGGGDGGGSSSSGD
jgi:hypothetical protein